VDKKSLVDVQKRNRIQEEIEGSEEERGKERPVHIQIRNGHSQQRKT
jgi:hypothetical protein